MTWQEVADGNNAVIHQTVEWGSILAAGTKGAEDSGDSPLWDQAPDMGGLPAKQRSALAAVLEGFTSTPDDCWFGVWEGNSFHGVLPDGPRLHLPQRSMLLFHGPVHAALNQFQGEGPNIWWPRDRAWCVATEVDLMSTYVGVSTDASMAILANPALEVVGARQGQRVTWDSDTINPLPEHPYRD
ncbi:hypothetical protein [Rhodococcus marinonascens]|uniref:hypothetical protein n=1 Tax=Rhodococcus marinonascens TaxID=38311 RepID=UPI0011147F0B|nr:hypothetical protein [Rhodococcus marinonascens]